MRSAAELGEGEEVALEEEERTGVWRSTRSGSEERCWEEEEEERSGVGRTRRRSGVEGGGGGVQCLEKEKE